MTDWTVREQRRAEREAERDRHGIKDTRKQRYLVTWRRYRKQVKKYQRVVNAVRYMYGLAPTRLTLPDGWGDDAAWSDAVLEPGRVSGKGKASAGPRESAARALGWRQAVEREAHALIDETMDMYGPDPDPYGPMRGDLTTIYMRLKLKAYESDEVNMLTCADWMAHPVPIPPDVDSAAPLGDLWYGGKYPLASTNWELRDGEMVLWVRGHEVTTRRGRIAVHEKFAAHHGWTMALKPALSSNEKAMWKRVKGAVIEALTHVDMDDVPEYVKRKGRVPLVWVVYDALGRRGVRACEQYAGRFKIHDDIEWVIEHLDVCVHDDAQTLTI